jgi:hypothetical protein
MTAILLAALLASSPPSAARPRADIRVTVTDVAGAADVVLADALARTLAEAGLTASPAHRPSGDCGDECVHVSVRKLAEHGFLVEVRARREVARAPVRLAATASSFDQVHALAIEAELLTERVTPPRRKQGPKTTLIASAQPAPASSPAGDVATDAPAPPLSPTSPAVDSSSADTPTMLAAPGAVSAALEQAQPRVAPADERWALNVAGMVLTDTAGDLFMRGVTLGLRLRVTRRLDASAFFTGMKAQNVVHRGDAYQLDMFPLALAAAVDIPGVPTLRVGGGVEGLLVGGERSGQKPPQYWSIGPIARLEHRYAVRAFALMSSLQLALHPTSWNTAGNGGPLVTVPQWTVGASVGLEFKLF